jgi:type I restriction enzyme, R subunit
LFIESETGITVDSLSFEGSALKTAAQRSLYDNLDQNEALTVNIDAAVRNTKKAGWVGNRMKEREVTKAVRETAKDYNIDLEDVMELIKNQHEYQ